MLTAPPCRHIFPLKPEALASANLIDYFDLSFTALPHKILMPDQFETAVKDLRKRFVDRARDDFVFKPSYHKRIPADGVAFYMEQIWVRYKLRLRARWISPLAR
jgi:hypothetical protein